MQADWTLIMFTIWFYCLGGGFGGKKESGQLRFGGSDRPFKKPIVPNIIRPHNWYNFVIKEFNFKLVELHLYCIINNY